MLLKKYCSLLILYLFLQPLAQANVRALHETQTTNVTADVAYLSLQSPEINQAMQRFQKTGEAPLIKTAQFLQFPYGHWQPIIECQPIRACDIALEEGEKINGIYLGDTERWLYEMGMTGEAESMQPHVIFKPKEYGISTNLIITTNRRAYYLGLISQKNSQVLQVKFYYPDDVQQSKRAMENKQKRQSAWAAQNNIAEVSANDFEKINFNYQIKSTSLFSNTPNWKPLRVFDDGTHVYIQMPKNLHSLDAPALFLLKPDGKMALVNYRVHHQYYIVDQLFRRAALVVDVGPNSKRIELVRQN